MLMIIIFVVSNCVLFFSVVVLTTQFFKKKKTKISKITEYSPKVGIIIPFFNEPPEILLKTLSAVEQLEYEGELELFLVDDGSTNDSLRQVTLWLKGDRRYAYSLICIDKNTGAKGKVMDHALATVLIGKPKVVGVIDSDTYLQPDALKLAVQTLYSRESNAAVCGFIVPVNEPNFSLNRFQYLEHIGFYSAIKQVQKQFGAVSVMAGAFTLHKADAIEKMGGWGKWLVEDIVWTWRARANGYTTDYAPDALAHTICPPSINTLFKQRSRWSRGRVEAFKASWKISKHRTMFIFPWQFVIFQFSIAPPVLLLPVAIYFSYSTILIYMIAVNLFLQLTVTSHTFLQKKRALKLPLMQLPLCLVINSISSVVLLPATIKGIIEEIFEKKHDWLTRK